ncbi:hypothetical protein U9M48_035839 [Paspalum notatum var. saurae]|uniref:Retrotransposon gag domain-containing protein n=1 Tax=Paspalum notatum var. saurae TaxID=547442 RepID=A0AAQ3UBU8_PASNO
MDDEWVRRHDMLEARNDTRPYAACMGFASEMHRMYDRAEGRSRFYFHVHAEARARVEEPEGRVARLRRRLAVYEPPPAEQDPQDRESSEPMEMEEEGEGSVPTGRSCPEPLDADDWLRTIRSKFTLLPELTEQQKARFAGQLLQGPAGAWHATFLEMQRAGHEPTWEEFTQAFRAHYISDSLMEQKKREFRELKQGNRTVMQYVQSFIHLSHYAPEDVADDPRRAARLLNGLDPTLQTHLGRRYQSFTDLVDTALDMENRLRVANEDQRRKRQANTSTAGSSQKQKTAYRPSQQYYQ